MNETSDTTITPFVQNKIKEGYSVVRQKNCDLDLLNPCPKCKSPYFYTFTKGLETLKECPFCHYKEIK